MPQLKSRVSVPGEPKEREADDVATRVTSGSSVARPMPLTRPRAAPVQRAAIDDDVQRAVDEQEIQRAPEADEPVQRAVDPDQPVARVATNDDQGVQRSADEQPQRKRGTKGPGGGSGALASRPNVTPRTAHTIANPGTGSPMPRSVRRSIEPHVGVRLSGVHVHTDGNAARAATSLGARAFTVGNDIFLNRGESPFNLGLMAHESAHVVQQGGASHPPVTVARRPADPDEIQRLPEFVTDQLAPLARHIPGYTLLTYIVEYDPLKGERVEQTPMTLLEGLMGLVPFGTFVFDQLRELGIVQPAFDFITAQLAAFDLSPSRLERTISEAAQEMDFLRTDFVEFNVGVAAAHLGRLMDDVRSFAGSVVSKVMDLIKQALIGVAEDLLAENKAWALIKKILHRDPLRGEAVEATTVEILQDFLLLIGRDKELEQMKVRGTLQTTADWIDTQVDQFRGLLGELGTLFSAAWDAIQPANLPQLPSALPALAQRASDLLQRVWDFAIAVAAHVIELIKDALLGWLSSFVNELPGFNLLTVILGKNPFTGEAVPRTGANMIWGFITLIPGGDAIFEKLAETGIIAELGARIDGAVETLGINWDFIVGLFKSVWDMVVSIDALLDPIGVFLRIRDRFGEPISRLFAFIAVVFQVMFELLLVLMKFPTDLIGHIITNAMAAFERIKADPIGFLMNMLAAVKQGFTNFFDHILPHLADGLVDWLFSVLRKAGIEPPKDLTLQSIVDFVLKVLDISIDKLWDKLAKRFGQETVDMIRGAIDKLMGIWTFVKDVSERGVSAVWEYVQDQLSNLWNSVLQAATDWIMDTIVNKVVAKLLSMLDPTGIMAVVNGFIAFFKAIQSAIDYLREMLEIVDMYVSTIAAIAAGDIAPGAAMLEAGLASMIPVAIGFLANQIGLGDIGTKIAEIVGKVRALVDKAIDWLLDKLQAMVKKVMQMLGLGDEDGDAVDFTVHEDLDLEGTDHDLDNKKGSFELVMASASPTLLNKHRVKAVKDAYAAYLDAIKKADKSGKKAAANKHLPAVVAAVKAAGNPNLPRLPAPGIGTVDRHSAQQKRLVDAGVDVWEMESEHVIPRVFVSAAMVGLGLPEVEAAGDEYKRMHTILIYKGAADVKTEGQGGDLSQAAGLKAAVEEEGRKTQSVSSLRKAVIDIMLEYTEPAVVRTFWAIKQENTINGKARGPVGKPEPPSPWDKKVWEAVTLQARDIDEDVIKKRIPRWPLSRV
jgi:hypothetical protein